MTRRFTAIIALAAILLFIMYDTSQFPPNAFNAPSAFALGSNEVNTGGFCGALPSK